MASDSFKVKKSLKIEPSATAVTEQGDIRVNSATGELTFYNASEDAVVTKTATQTLTNKTLTSPTITGPSGLSKSDVGLGNVDNTSDATKNAASVTLTNKTIDADLNTITNIENADIKAGAAIARSKLASGTNSHVIINDGSGVMSSEAQLAVTRGGTGQSTATAAFNALSPLTTKGDILTNDNTDDVRLAVGTDGHILTADSTQAKGIKWAAPAAATPVQSEVQVDGQNGYGSTNTKIPRFSNTSRTRGSDITYADTAANGASFTINTAGVYTCYMNAEFAANTVGFIGISCNSASLTTNINSLAYRSGSNTGKLCQARSAINAGDESFPSVSWTGYLDASDVIRPHTNAATTTTASAWTFGICRVD